MSDLSPADMKVSPPKKSFWRNLSFVWLVPLLALAVSLGIAWQNYADRGTLVTISFGNASGISQGETTLRYRDVVVGQVERVNFTDDLGRVLVNVRVDNEIVPFMDDESVFWVVRPEVSARGISGLSTVLSGVYIEGAWDNVAGNPMTEFVGADSPPLVQPGRPGKRITLATDDGTTISYGSPVLFRGVEVGRLETPRLSADGRTVLVDAFIDAPHDARLSQATRFWDSSGFELSFGTAGFEVDFDSLASLLTGGIQFDNLYEDGEEIGPGYVFTLYEDEEEARRNRLVRGVARGVPFSIQFDESVAGLEAGDEVTYQGLDVGVVTELRSSIQETPFGPQLTLVADVSIDPLRMGLPPDATPEQTVEFFRFAVSTGMRARLATESLLSSDLRVELVVLDDVSADRLVETDDGHPLLPSVESNLSDFTATAEGVLERINALPIEEVMDQAISLMDSFEQLARNEDLQRVPGSTVALIDDARALVGSEAIQSIPAQIEAAVEDLTALVAEVREGGAVASLNSALARLDEAMVGINEASQSAPALAQNLTRLTEEEIPAVLSELQGVAQTAQDLELDALVAGATQTLNRVDALLAQEAVQSIPASVNAAIADVRTVVADLQAEGAVESLGRALRNLDRVMADASVASQDAPALTANLRQITETDIPALLGELEAVAKTANELELQALVDSATGTLNRVDALIGSDETMDLPGTINDALTEMRLALSELRQGGVVENLNATLQSASDAAGSVAESVEDLPQLTARLERLVGETEAVIGSYGARSDFNQQTLSALREVQNAAKSISELARAIERSPNSLIFGR
ncbi:MlaD family protein [Marivita hallyeonensis]|uniref:Paraquat-inducible protein B n=1 Tax=Marivita hallyeonensis TaxID=996342 RepID=A0A1M5WHC8_9RHOB|nr:MlaD family protein [Marivita hallyeonensis]SHH86890.1 paraquat-inducible protein B [Marivita hallyeonensis]